MNAEAGSHLSVNSFNYCAARGISPQRGHDSEGHHLGDEGTSGWNSVSFSTRGDFRVPPVFKVGLTTDSDPRT